MLQLAPRSPPFLALVAGRGAYGGKRKEAGSQPEAKGASRDALRQLWPSASFPPCLGEV